MTYNDLPWAGVFNRRCKAIITKGEAGDYYGRCELKVHDEAVVAHALERGMVWVRWTNDVQWTGAGEDGIVVDGLFVPEFMLHAPRGGLKYPKPKEMPDD